MEERENNHRKIITLIYESKSHNSGAVLYIYRLVAKKYFIDEMNHRKKQQPGLRGCGHRTPTQEVGELKLSQLYQHRSRSPFSELDLHARTEIRQSLCKVVKIRIVLCVLNMANRVRYAFQ